MRAFTKAAAFLSSTYVSALVIPESSSFSIPQSNNVIEYHPHEALLKFAFPNREPIQGYTISTFQVQGTDKECGESKVRLNGQELDTKWDGTTATGHDYLDSFGGSEAEWHISCLFGTVPANGRNFNGQDVIHLLSFRLNSPKKGVPSNFTVSYKQIDSPAILRFSPNYNREGSAGGFGATERWGTPSEEFDPDVLANEHKDASIVSSDTISQGQKSLGVQYGRLKTSLKKGIKNVVGLLGHKHADSLDEKATSISPDRLLGPPYKSDEESTSTIDTSSSSITLPNLPAAETPAFTSTEALEQPTMPTSTTLFSQSNFNIHLLKLFGLFLVVLSCLTWLSLRWRDPRRQVDWAARREERRTKRMYRRAARQQALRNWVWNFRLKYGLAPRAAISWDEKRTRVLKQEAVLEDVMGADIRALRRAHSVVSQITAAEEGRNAFEYEAEGPGRRRSVSTLPGYESEGSQPPSYDDAGASIECTTVVDNFQFTHAETEYTTDSSVISTSPRLSRDGTYSDLDEKFDSISLEAGNLAGSGL